MIDNINKFEKYFKNFLIGALILFLYFTLPNFAGIFFYLFKVNTLTVPIIIRLVYSIIYNIFIMAVIMLICNKTLENDFNDLKINHKKYYGECFKYWIIGLIIMVTSNIIIATLFNTNGADNQKDIIDLFNKLPLYTYFSAVIYAPIVEELTFRKAIKNIIPNKYLFVIVSGLFFGGLHVIDSFDKWYDLLYIIPYSSMGIAFAYMYQKTNNIFTSMGYHFMHNGILMTLQFIVLLFG